MVAVVLDQQLPETYDRTLFTEKCHKVIDLMVDYASQGFKWASQVCRWKLLEQSPVPVCHCRFRFPVFFRVFCGLKYPVPPLPIPHFWSSSLPPCLG
jgi:hypothetical protein